MEINTNVKFNEFAIGAEAEALAPMDEVDVVATAPEAKVTLMTNGAEALIPVEELGMEAEEENEYAEAEAQGFFSETIGMSRVETEDGLVFYADRRAKKGHIFYELRLPLYNGQVSPLVTIKQSDLTLAVQNNFIANKILTPGLKKQLDKFLDNIVLELLDIGIVYDNYTIYTILRTLFNSREKLSDYSEEEQSEQRRFYRDVVKAINGQEPFQPIMLAYKAKAYYPLAIGEMEYIAHQFKLTATELAKKLDRFGFLHRTSSSTGYQVKVRVLPDEKATEMGVSAFDNCYCVRKLDNASLQSLQQRLNAKNP